MSEHKQPGLLELLEQWEKQGASDAEKTMWMNRYLDAKARNQGIPLHGTFELTPLCNLDCKMCYVHLSQKQLKESGKELLTVEQWKNIMDQAIAEGMLHATLTGGEALLYPGFDELYLHLMEQGVEVTVKTNGLLLTEERVTFFSEHPPAGIQISIYGADEDTYEQVTGVRGYAVVMEGMNRVIKAGIAVDVSVTPSKPMLSGLETLITYLSSLKVHYGTSPGLLIPREETGRSGNNMELSLDDYVWLYKLQARIAKKTLYPICKEEVPLPSTNSTPAFGLRCAAGKSYFAVHWNGMLHPCVSFTDVGSDVLRYSFHEAWTFVNRRVLAYPFPRECVDCKMQDFCPVCVVQHAYGADKGHANPSFCQRACRLIEEGLISMNDLERRK